MILKINLLRRTISLNPKLEPELVKEIPHPKRILLKRSKLMGMILEAQKVNLRKLKARTLLLQK